MMPVEVSTTSHVSFYSWLCFGTGRYPELPGSHQKSVTSEKSGQQLQIDERIDNRKWQSIAWRKGSSTSF